MNFDWGTLFGMALQTVVEPRKVARDVQSVDLPRQTLWEILGLLLVAATFLGVIGSILFPVDPANNAFGPLATDPVMMGIAQGSTSVLTVFVIYWIGRAVGGTGSFDAALLTVIWMQFVALIVALGVLFLGIFAPGLSLLLTGMGMVMSFWILSHFIAEMHGFRSAALVFAGILTTGILLMLGMSIILGMITFFIPVETGAF